MAEHGLKRESDLEELSAWLDGELEPSAAERVERLVATDPDWRATHEQFLAVDAAMKLLPPARPRRDLADRIVSRAFRRRRVVRAVVVAAPLAAAGIIVAILLAWPGKPPAREAPPGLATGVEEVQKDALAEKPVTQEALAAVELEIERILRDVRPEYRYIVRELSLFENYNEVLDYEQVHEIVDDKTISALVALEAAGKL